jgi:hypothetical protein
MIKDLIKYLMKEKTINYKYSFVNYIPELKYSDPDLYNKYESNINLDCIKEYINKNKKFNKINCHSFQIIYRVNNNINLTSFNIRILDEAYKNR